MSFALCWLHHRIITITTITTTTTTTTTAVSSVMFMEYMFYGASAFNQTICGWDLSGVYTTTLMFTGSSGNVILTCSPSFVPTALPTLEPTALPTLEPTLLPTALPTLEPTVIPTTTPTDSCHLGQFFNTSESQCVDCATGMHGEEEDINGRVVYVCVVCSAGKYAATKGSQSCALCPSGTYNDKIASEGDASDHDSVDDCLSCPDGQFANDERTKCAPCIAGQYTYNGTECRNCTSGTYAPQALKDNCLPCDAGKYAESITGAVSCTACSSGKYSPRTRAIVCSSCPAGTFSASSAVICTPCSSGRYAAEEESHHCSEWCVMTVSLLPRTPPHLPV